MQSNLRIHSRIFSSIVLMLAVASSVFAVSDAHAETEAYRRQVKFETERAKDFRRFLRYLAQIERERMSAVDRYQEKKAQADTRQEKARRSYVEFRKREEAKKLSDEYIERMIAAEAAKDDKRREAIRREYVKVQEEIERAIENSRLDEAEEFGLAR